MGFFTSKDDFEASIDTVRNMAENEAKETETDKD